jgi:hypothetical protein
MTLSLRIAWLGFGTAALALTGCYPDGGCHSTITGNENAVTQACGGSGEDATAVVTTPAPVIVNPPVVIVPIVPPAEGGGP